MNDKLFQLIDCFIYEDNDVLDFVLKTINDIFYIGIDSENKNLLESCGRILYPKREELLNHAVDLIPFLHVNVIDNKNDTNFIYSQLLVLFSSILQIYDYESTTNNETHRSIPSDFICSYNDKIIELLGIAYQLNLNDESVGFGFLNLIKQICISYNTSCRMNIKLHKPNINNYLIFLTSKSSSKNVSLYAKQIKSIYYDRI